MTAETIARALGGRKAGQDWMARCPAHGDRDPRLSVREVDGKVLVRCHTGCDQREVIVLADGDDPGEAAARDCALRWQREGRRVRIARPPRGQDFNDMLNGHAPRNGEGRK